jgi:RNA recognition motif-containing protein
MAGKSAAPVPSFDDIVGMDAPADAESSIRASVPVTTGLATGPGMAAAKDEAREGELDDPERLSRTAFVGNVAATVKRKDLKKMFKAFGAVEAVRLRGVVAANPKLPKKTALLARRMHTSCDTLLAYVVFKPVDGAKTVPNDGGEYSVGAPVLAACAALNLTVFMEKHLRVTPAVHTRGPLRQSIFLGNLPFDVTEEELIMLFTEPAKAAGSSLVGVRVTRDKETGMGRGVGFASFDDELGVRAVMNLQGDLKIRDRVIRMERAAKEKKRNSKTAKKLAKGEERRMEKKKRKTGEAATFYAERADKRAEKRRRQRERKSMPGVTRKIKKEVSQKKTKVKIKHAARKARQAAAAAGGVNVGSHAN